MRRGVVAGTLGLVATLAALGFVLAPDILRAVGPVDQAVGVVAAQDPQSLMLAVGAFAGLLALFVSRTASRRAPNSPHGSRRIVEQPPEHVTSDAPMRAGGDVDRQRARAVEGDPAAQADLQATLHAAAVRALAGDPETTPEQAREAVNAGTWTDDDLAAAFLGEPTPSLLARLRAWLDPVAEYERRIERTVTAIEAVGGERR